MKREIDIYGSAHRLEQAVKRLQKSDILQANKNSIMGFRDFCSTDGMSVVRIDRYIGVLAEKAKSVFFFGYLR